MTNLAQPVGEILIMALGHLEAIGGIGLMAVVAVGEVHKTSQNLEMAAIFTIN